MNELRERVARAIGAEIQALWADEDAPLGYEGGYQRIADAVIAIAIEECALIADGARVADKYRFSFSPEEILTRDNTANFIAMRIRALNNKVQG